MGDSQSSARQRQFYTVPEAADMLHVSPATVWRWIAAGKLPAQRVGPRNIRIMESDIECMIRPIRAKQVGVEEVGLKPLGVKEVGVKETVPLEAVSQEELARRQALVAQILAKRKERVITPLTTTDLVRKDRVERARSYGH